MIYITGDTHGEPSRFFTFPGIQGWGEGCTLIVCGDFGYLFRDDQAEAAFLDELEQRPFQILFVDGNHENFPAIYRYPVEKWQGGNTHRIRRNIRHLMRGQIFELEGKSFFTMGGAYSTDRAIRTLGKSYWPEELPNNDEYREASANLAAHDYAVDYILTHTAPARVIRQMGYSPDRHDAELTGYFDYLFQTVRFRHWYCGHWHEDREIGDNFSVVWLNTTVL